MVVSEEVSGEVVVEESEEVSCEEVSCEEVSCEEVSCEVVSGEVVSCEELVRLAREGSVEYTRYN